MHSSEKTSILFLSHELATDKDCKKRKQLDDSPAFFLQFVSLFFFFPTRVALAVVCWVGHNDAMIRGMVLCL